LRSASLRAGAPFLRERIPQGRKGEVPEESVSSGGKGDSPKTGEKESKGKKKDFRYFSKVPA